MTWKDDVLEAMKRLNKESSLQEIYDQIPSIRPNLGSNWKARVRATLEENSSESEAWLGKDDLFFMVEKGSGIWSLKESNKNKDGFLYVYGTGRFTVNKLGIQLFDFETESEEVFDKGKLIKYSSKTIQNEKEKFSNIKLKNNKLFIEGSS